MLPEGVAVLPAVLTHIAAVVSPRHYPEWQHAAWSLMQPRSACRARRRPGVATAAAKMAARVGGWAGLLYKFLRIKKRYKDCFRN